MLKFLLLSLLAVACSGVPVDVPAADPDNQENAADSELNDNVFQQYKTEVQQVVGKLPPQVNFDNYKEEDVKFYLYTREVPSKRELLISDKESLYNSSYNPRKETKVIIPCWMFTEEYYDELVSAYLRNHEESLNVITVDYSAYASIDFNHVPQLVEQVGKTLGKLLGMLYAYRSHPDNIHMIGHGFGAHVAGAAAKSIFPLKVGRISGLDPIGLVYHRNRSLIQLEMNDADFIDTIMTTTKGFGSAKPRGHVRFYPNGGMTQPMPPSGSGTPGYNMYVSHAKAYYYFVESVVLPYAFLSKKAHSYGDYIMGKTSKWSAYMGESVSKRANGDFYLDTNRLPPYGQSKAPGSADSKPNFSYDADAPASTGGMLFPPTKDEPADQYKQQGSDQGQPEVQKALRKEKRSGSENFDLEHRDLGRQSDPIYWNKRI
jgi:hypothetical protein